MATQSSLVLPDGQGSPVNHTFSPRGASPLLAKWEDITSGIRIGLPTITLGTKSTDGANGAYRTEGRIVVPVLETISGDAGGYLAVPRPAFSMFGRVELVSPNRASLQNRKDLRAFMYALLGHATFLSAFNDFEIPT